MMDYQDIFSGGVFAKKKGKELHVFDPSTVMNADRYPVRTKGAPTVRTLSDRFADIIDVRDFGAKPDFNSSTKTGTDNLQCIQAAIYHCAAHNIKLRIAGGKYGCWNSGNKRVLSNAASAFNGQYLGGLDIPSGTVIEWADDSWLVQMQPSYAGAFLSNINRPIWMDDTSSVDWSTDGVLLINPRIDGSYMPLFTDLTLSQEMTEPCNDNAIGFAGHHRTVNGALSSTLFDDARNITIHGGFLRGYRDINGLGGKGIALERGGHHLTAVGTRIEDCCFATSVIFETSGAKASHGISFSAMDVRRCGFALMANGQDAGKRGPCPTRIKVLCTGRERRGVAGIIRTFRRLKQRITDGITSTAWCFCMLQLGHAWISSLITLRDSRTPHTLAAGLVILRLILFLIQIPHKAQTHIMNQ